MYNSFLLVNNTSIKLLKTKSGNTLKIKVKNSIILLPCPIIYCAYLVPAKKLYSVMSLVDKWVLT